MSLYLLTYALLVHTRTSDFCTLFLSKAPAVELSSNIDARQTCRQLESLKDDVQQEPLFENIEWGCDARATTPHLNRRQLRSSSQFVEANRSEGGCKDRAWNVDVCFGSLRGSQAF